jgi:hypothetical protein
MLLFAHARVCRPSHPRITRPAPRGPDWLHEAKFDGWRIQLHKDGSVVRLYTKSGYGCTGHFGGLTSALAAVPAASVERDGIGCDIGAAVFAPSCQPKHGIAPIIMKPAHRGDEHVCQSSALLVLACDSQPLGAAFNLELAIAIRMCAAQRDRGTANELVASEQDVARSRC